MDDIFIRLLAELPHETLGVTVRDENGDYNVYLNPLYDRETLRKTVAHEMKHIENGDFWRDGPIDQMELAADN